MDEWIDVLDATGVKTGEVRLKSEAHRDGLWHRCFHCWVVYVPQGDEPMLILQRRAMEKDTWPGRLDVSVGGHLSAGEDILDGRREMREELGLNVEAEDLIPLGERRAERRIPQGMDREFHGVYLFISGTPPSQMKLQPEEVDSVVLVTFGDAVLFAGGSEVSATEFSKDGTSSPTNISPDETVNESEEYFRWAVAGIGGELKRIREKPE
ncbi:MAG: NUDIX hydrolase [Rubrobacter sp.]